MSHLETISPEKFLLRSSAFNFQIILTTGKEQLSWIDESFQKIEEDTGSVLKNIRTYSREELIKAYYKAAKKAMELSGRLLIIEIN